jgi:hypothetical protein
VAGAGNERDHGSRGADSGKARRSRLPTILAVTQALVLLAAVAYIVYGLAGQWAELRRHAWTLRLWPVIVSAPAAAAWFLCRAWLWQRILICFGHPLAYRRAFRAFMLSELSRYLPGTVWHMLSRAYLSDRQGVPAPVVFAGIMLELALVALTAIAFFPLRAMGQAVLPQQLALWVAAASLLMLVLAHPRVVLPLVNVALRRLGRPAIAGRLRYRDLFAMLALCVVMWLCLCVGFWLLAYGIAPASARNLVAVTASFPVAWFVGLVALVSPGGLGVREGVLAALLAGLLPGGVAVVVALAARVWLACVELACAAVAWRVRQEG